MEQPRIHGFLHGGVFRGQAGRGENLSVPGFADGAGSGVALHKAQIVPDSRHGFQGGLQPCDVLQIFFDPLLMI